MIVIIDYGVGNLGSIANMFKKIGVPATVSGKADDIHSASKLVLPGVGSFDNCVSNIHERMLLDVLNDKVVKRQTPLLGICLGMQLLSRRSEEGTLPGLGWIDAETIRFAFPKHEEQLKVPHMGWNSIEPVVNEGIFYEIPCSPRFYFVHSYHVVCRNPENVLARARYGFQFCAAVRQQHILGVQFHPEKSHKFGMKLLQNFSALAPC